MCNKCHCGTGVFWIFAHENSGKHSPANSGECILPHDSWSKGQRVGSIIILTIQIDKAAEYLSANKHTVVIVSGGKGPGEDISEAKAMQQGLIAQGIEEARIMMEDKSTTTHENIVFSKELIPDTATSGLIVSNDFHIYRAVEIAKKEGLDMKGLPAKTPKVSLLKSYTREYLAITKYYLTGVIGR